jgi:aldose 1-epimerase
MRPLAVPHPTGRQYQIGHCGQRAVVVQVGGGLREYEVDGFPVLDGYGVDEMASSGRGQVLVPWPNRLGGGCYEWAGLTQQLALNEPAKQNAIHGLVRWSTWELLESTPSRCRLGHVLWPSPGYPFTLALEIDYELSDAGLRVTMSAENAGRQPAPYGAGQHPYVRAEMGAPDASWLRLPADTWLEMDERQVPTGRTLSVAGTDRDFREARQLAATRLDSAFTDLRREADGQARVELDSSDRARGVVVWLDRAFEHLMVFTGDALAAPERRRSIAIEPMTCAPDAFRNGLGLKVLEPAERVSASWGIQVRQRAGGRA